MKSLLFNKTIVPCLLVALAGCTQESGNTTVQEGPFGETVTEFSACVEEIATDGQDTRGTSSFTYSFDWELGDKLGFWPDDSEVTYGEPMQVIFDVESKKGNTAIFRGNGWGLLRGSLYHSYYPYESSSSSDRVEVSYLGQRPASNGSTSHLRGYDYLYSSASVPTQGSLSLTYSHVSCFGRFIVTVPEAAKSYSFTQFTLSCGSKVLTESVVYNPSDAASVVKQNKTDELFYYLGTSSGITPDAENKVEIDIAMFPAALNGKVLTVQLADDNGNAVSGTCTPTKDQQKGTAYKYSVTNTVIGGSGINLSKSGSANCYIVSSAGNYRFRAVEGNTTTAVDVKGVKVLWESNGTVTAPSAGAIINRNVTYSDGYIFFSTASTFKKGNALIAAYSDAGCSEGNVLWSWHIWCTDKPADQCYKRDAGYLMDRNIGALSSRGDLSAGLFYQWGRKDPFMGSASISSNQQMVSNGSFNKVACSASTGTVQWSQKYPTSFLTNGSSPLDWLYAADGTLWYNSDGSKTKYDPCPPGYKVISGSKTASSEAGYGFWAKALNLGTKLTTTGDSFTTPSGDIVTLVGKELQFPLASGYAYYPLSGCLNEGEGQLLYGSTNVMVWSDYPAGRDDAGNWNTQYSGVLDGNFESSPRAFCLNWNSGRAAGKNVRCMVISEKSGGSANGENEGFGSNPTRSSW